MRLLRPAGVRLFWILSAVVLAAFSSCRPGPGRIVCRGPAVPLPQICGATLRDPEISCAVPADVQGGLRQANYSVRQRAADLFSWQVFTAVEWPALRGQRGVPDAAAPVSAPGPRVWETWKETSEVFLEKDGKPVAPAPWDTPEPLPASCGGAGKALFRDEKVDDALDAVVQPTYADGTLPGTLTDQARHRVRFEIRMNRTAFDYIVDHHLWDGTAQAKAGEVRFPAGSQIVKAAWRELPQGDAAAAGRFQTSDACVCEQDAMGKAIDCHRQQVGLVGFHLMSKTPSAPQWVWSTFEQVENVAGLHPSFRNPRCPDCPENRQLRPGLPNQVSRVIPIPSANPDCSRPGQAVDNIAQLNRDMQAALGRAGSVLQRYELVATQWPDVTAPAVQGQPPTVFEAVPALLGNTTLETYIQDTSSCMGCHAVAGTDRTPAWASADFTFTLNDAWPNPNTTPTNPDPDKVPRTVRKIAPPAKPETDWDQEHWASIEAGYQIAIRTYELLPQNVGSKLHCASCHLGAGRDPDAAWWVGMLKKYKGLPALYNRINQCFSRSENGTALCAVNTAPQVTACAQSQPMNALVTYMEWLDEQWQRKYLGVTPPNGYPCLPGPQRPVSAARGGPIYTQKCAFCHNAHGQGRYESDTYYRPAVWGPESYNAEAGLGNNLTYLAEFIHANMPYGNGGALTGQEAWDVAYFIDQQDRPGRTSSTGEPPNSPVTCAPEVSGQP
jgi:cytochrome c